MIGYHDFRADQGSSVVFQSDVGSSALATLPMKIFINLIRTAKQFTLLHSEWSFGRSECNRVKQPLNLLTNNFAYILMYAVGP